MTKMSRVKSTVIQGAAGLGNIDVLARGKQTVMPPSIHPETGMPYVNIGTPLLEAPLDQLPAVTPDDLEALRVALGSEHILPILDGTRTHDAGVALTGRLVAKGVADEQITALFSTFLPEGYEGNTLEELPGWIASAREKGFGEQEGGQSESVTAALVTLGSGDGVEFFNDGNGTAYATVPTEQGRETLRLPSDSFKRWLRHRAHRAFEKPLASSGPLLEAMLTLEGTALFDGPSEHVFLRVAGDRERVEVDLGRPDGHVVSITAGGWTVEPRARFKLARGGGFGALPDPVKGKGLRLLRALLNLDEATYHLLAAFLLNALKPDGPYFVGLVQGEQGSGKSLFTQLIKRIIDPNQVERLRLPDNDRDLMIQAKEFRLLNYDNASGMKADISDALCSLSTGGGIAVRKLYTDGDLNVLSFQRPFVINGISNFVNRPDLMERAIPIRLSPVAEGGRKEEAEIFAEFEAMLPAVLGDLYTAVASAQRNRASVEPPTGLRMADAARWILAGAKALDMGGDTLIAAIEAAQNEFVVERISDDPLFLKLRAVTQLKPFEGYVGELFADIEAARDPLLPKTPMHLSAASTRMRPAMAKAGVMVEFGAKDRNGRPIRITSDRKGPPLELKF